MAETPDNPNAKPDDDGDAAGDSAAPGESQPQPAPQAGDAAPAPPDAAQTSGDPPADASPEQVAEQSLDTAQQATDDIKAANDNSAVLDLPDFTSQNGESSGGAAGLGMLNDIDLNVRVELGRTRMYIEDVLKLNANSIVELDKAAGDPVDIFVNDRHVARGEVLVLSENFAVRVSEIIKQPEQED